jgi:hypothetical protein
VAAALDDGQHEPMAASILAKLELRVQQKKTSVSAARVARQLAEVSGLPWRTQRLSVLLKGKLLGPRRCRRRASSFWPVGANPAEALAGHGDAWRFVSVQESTLFVTRTGSILVRAPSPRGRACRLVMPSVANITGQAYARAWTNSRPIRDVCFLSSRGLS